MVDLAGVLLEEVALEKVATPMGLTLTLVIGDEKLGLEWRVGELLLGTSTGLSPRVSMREAMQLTFSIN